MTEIVVADRRVMLHSEGETRRFVPGEEIPEGFADKYVPRPKAVAEAEEGSEPVPGDLTTGDSLLEWVADTSDEEHQRARARSVYHQEMARTKPRKGVLEGLTKLLAEDE